MTLAAYEAWGAIGDGAVDDTDAIRACHIWCMDNGEVCRPLGRRYRVTAPIIDYDVARDGPGKRLVIDGAGPERTIFYINSDIAGSLFCVAGDRSAYGQPRAAHWAFRNFSILSDGKVDCDLFRIESAHHIDIINVSAQNCRGYGIIAREWWDSQASPIFIWCGDDGAGTGPNTAKKEVINLNYLHGGANLTLSACNNIDFGSQTHIASSRHVAMYWGPATRQNLFQGKIHGIIGGAISQPHIILDGAGRNSFVGATFTLAGGVCIDVRNDSNYVPFQNVFTGCRFDSEGQCCIRLRGTQRHVIVGNSFMNDRAGVVVKDGGAQNMIAGNTCNGGAEMIVNEACAMDALRFGGDVELLSADAGVIMISPNGRRWRVTVTDDGDLLVI